MRQRPRLSLPATLLAAAVLATFGAEARAQSPVIFVSTGVNVLSASSTLNGTAVDPTEFRNDLVMFNSPSVIVLFPNGTFGFVANDQASANGVNSPFPVYGTVHPLSNGYIQLIGNLNTVHNGDATATGNVAGVLLKVNGQWYAILFVVETNTYPVINGDSGPGTDVVVDVGEVVIPLRVVQ